MSEPPPFTRLFELDLPHGRCVGVSLPAWTAPASASAGAGAGAEPGDAIPAAALAALHDDERRHAATLGSIRRITWVGGRLALRAALDAALHAAPDDRSLAAAGAILHTARGAPLLPEGVVGSISHKEGLAVGLAARAGGGWRVGVDIERVAPRRSDLARYVLRPEERERLAPLSDPARRQAQILAAFSAKEAIYKALDPFVGRYVAFDEVAVLLHGDGAAEVTLHLRGGAGAGAGAPVREAPFEGPFDVELAWQRRDELILSTARVRPRS